MPDGAAPFRRVAIVGVGLIGGSLAAALRAVAPAVEITALDRPDVLDDASRRGWIDRRATALEELQDADLIVLATPVPDILTVLPKLAPLSHRAVVTDVGSTKRHVLRAAEQAGIATFIGGHPVAGLERPGIGNARADLFNGQPWLLVPAASVPESAIARMEQFVGVLGAVPHRLDAERHDRTMAYVSHLPQLLAVALMNTAGAAIGEDGLRLSGRAFGEMTRLASSPSDVWQGILSTNADYVADAAAAMVAALPTQPARLDAARWIEETFERAGEWRRRVAPARRAEPQ